MTSLTGFTGLGPTGANLQGMATPAAKRGPRGAAEGEYIPKGYRKGQVSNWNPRQEEIFSQGADLIGPDSYLRRLAGGDEETFNQLEAPALRQFAGLQGGIASRFSGMGSTGARRSSGHQNTQTAAANNFAQELQARRQELMRNATLDIGNMTNMLLGQRQHENLVTPARRKAPTFWEGVGTTAANAAANKFGESVFGGFNPFEGGGGGGGGNQSGVGGLASYASMAAGG